LAWSWFLWTSNSQQWTIAERGFNGRTSHAFLWNNCWRDQFKEGRSVNARINHRGSFKYHRMIDLAHGAASELNITCTGEIDVRPEVVDWLID
jgi:hypothetical protein